MRTTSKWLSLTVLVIAEAVGMNLWFTSAAVLPDMARETALPADRQALLSSAVQAGFVLGALGLAITGLADRFDPRRVFCISALAAAVVNLVLLLPPLGSDLAVAGRFLTGALLAGVYPVGMKLAVGWGLKDRGFLVGLLVGGLTLGKSLPYLAAFLGGTDWRLAILAASLLAALGGLLVLMVGLGPHHATAPRFRPSAIGLAWKDSRIRRAYIGYLGHMWELYALWAWVAAAAGASYMARLEPAAAESLAKLTAFLAIALGGLVCVLAGRLADRFGKAEVAITALAISGSAALLSALAFGGPVWLSFLLFLIWGLAVIPDSAQFSALVADYAPPQLAGSLLAFQTALGFGLTIVTVQVTPLLANAVGWPATLALMAIGPIIGLVAMRPLCGRPSR
ncbi:MFS transporter [Fodinicurvata fenggangensis]|uniref:MFS transporter n=1 Tax=Fodinicurvata fenggangensis TaxID=1121830 RepID=UPI00047DF81C|nr:MFS transporter [Fodinicurvata fenggangensis]